jgi:hypothetical protein
MNVRAISTETSIPSGLAALYSHEFYVVCIRLNDPIANTDTPWFTTSTSMTGSVHFPFCLTGPSSAQTKF